MVQVDLITGFLGSGKTTFMRHYARYSRLERRRTTGMRPAKPILRAYNCQLIKLSLNFCRTSFWNRPLSKE